MGKVILECPQCSAQLEYESETGMLLCSYCGYKDIQKEDAETIRAKTELLRVQYEHERQIRALEKNKKRSKNNTIMIIVGVVLFPISFIGPSLNLPVFICLLLNMLGFGEYICFVKD